MVNGLQGVACSIPLFQKGEIIGAFSYSIFMEIWDKSLRDNVMSGILGKHDENREFFSARYTLDSLIGQNQDFVNLKYLAKTIAHHEDIAVLITGESGTGKELLAQAIHNSSQRAPHPFVRINCASIPDALLESELFGYEDGAYTGARKGGKPGKFELAHNGTVFLDEIGEMPLLMQSKLLIFLQDHIVERLGGNRPFKVNVRVIAATNRNLEKMVNEETFRKDLYYRINMGRLELPPLRQRKDDIPLLVEHFIKVLSARLDIHLNEPSPGILHILQQYNWTGNVRELENVLARAMIVANSENSDDLRPHHLSIPRKPEFGDNGETNTNIEDLKTMIGKYEKKVLIQMLKETNYDKVMAARYLGIDLSSLYRKARKYNIVD
jgi:transcriptional regulator with PAS, ATPase and Fis domain